MKPGGVGVWPKGFRDPVGVGKGLGRGKVGWDLWGRKGLGEHKSWEAEHRVSRGGLGKGSLAHAWTPRASPNTEVATVLLNDSHV